MRTVGDDEKKRVRDWIAAAIADGWAHEPTYKYEDESRAIRLTRDGFVAMALTREPIPGDRWATHTEYKISAWGPDELCIHVTHPYSFAALQAAVRRCDNCKKDDVDCHRYSFAGRCCADCLTAMRAQHEKPGWCD